MSNTRPTAIAIIPARAGSKRLPRKNVAELRGHPLISYTIRAAQKADWLTDYLVSSEDEEILEIARKYGAPTPFKRPSELATDEVRNTEVLIHALEYMEQARGFQYNIIVLLQPTSPVRNPRHIDEAVKNLWESDLPTLVAVKGPFQKRDPILKRINEKGELVPYCTNPDVHSREPFYIYNAALYAVKREYLLSERSWVSERQVPLIMDEFHSTDIDEMVDLLTAESYLRYLESIKEGK